MKWDAEVRLHDTSVSFWIDSGSAEAFNRTKKDMEVALDLFRSNGFRVEPDPDVLKNYKSLLGTHWYCRHGDLEANVQAVGRVLEIEFFQNVANVENRCGGRYDFNKAKRMPRVMLYKCATQISRLVRAMQSRGYKIRQGNYLPEPMPLSVLKAMKGEEWNDESQVENFQRGWGWGRKLELGPDGWPAEKLYVGHGWDDRDRDGKPIRCGMVKYIRSKCRGSSGRLFRGVVCTAGDDNWTIWCNGQKLSCQTKDLFDCDPSLEPRRFVPKQNERLQQELEKAMKSKDYRRVQVIARVLERMSA